MIAYIVPLNISAFKTIDSNRRSWNKL